MSKIFEFLTAKGSRLASAGNSPFNVAGGNYVTANKGKAMVQNTTEPIVFNTPLDLSSDVIAFHSYFNYDDKASWGYYIFNGNSASNVNTFYLVIETDLFFGGIGGYAYLNVGFGNKYKNQDILLSFVYYKLTGNYKVLVNTQQITQGITAINLNFEVTSLNSHISYPGKITNYGWVIRDDDDQEEINKLYVNFLNSKPIYLPKTNFYLPIHSGNGRVKSNISFYEDCTNYAVGNKPTDYKTTGGFIISEDAQGKFILCQSSGTLSYPLADANLKYTKLLSGNMTLASDSTHVILSATTGQILRKLVLTETANA